jgi:hypothetical protein
LASAWLSAKRGPSPRAGHVAHGRGPAPGHVRATVGAWARFRSSPRALDLGSRRRTPFRRELDTCLTAEGRRVGTCGQRPVCGPASSRRRSVTWPTYITHAQQHTPHHTLNTQTHRTVAPPTPLAPPRYRSSPPLCRATAPCCFTPLRPAASLRPRPPTACSFPSLVASPTAPPPSARGRPLPCHLPHRVTSRLPQRTTAPSLLPLLEETKAIGESSGVGEGTRHP